MLINPSFEGFLVLCKVSSILHCQNNPSTFKSAKLNWLQQSILWQCCRLDGSWTAVSHKAWESAEQWVGKCSVNIPVPREGVALISSLLCSCLIYEARVDDGGVLRYFLKTPWKALLLMVFYLMLIHFLLKQEVWVGHSEGLVPF